MSLLFFALNNPATFSLQPDGPIPFLLKMVTKNIPPIPDSVDFSSKTILVTGSNSGCGLDAAKDFACRGAKLIITARSTEKGESALKEILSVAPTADVEVWLLDLASWESIRQFVKRANSYSKLDIAVLNAGTYHNKYTVCHKTGYEINFQTHMLSNALLGLLLLPILERSATDVPSRLLIITSEVHAFMSPKLTAVELIEHLNKKDSCPVYHRYHISKLMIQLWTKELSEKVDTKKVLVGTATPGFSSSGLFRSVTGNIINAIINKTMARDSAAGARIYTHALLAPADEFHGGYFSHGKLTPTSNWTRSAEGSQVQKDLWEEILVILKREEPDIEKLLH